MEIQYQQAKVNNENLAQEVNTYIGYKEIVKEHIENSYLDLKISLENNEYQLNNTKILIIKEKDLFLTELAKMLL